VETTVVGSGTTLPPSAIDKASRIWEIIDPEIQGTSSRGFIFIDDDEPTPRPHLSSQGGACQVAQVEIQAGGAQPSVVSAGNPVFQQIIRNNVPPKFTGRPQDWGIFVQDWERYLRRLSVCVPTLNNQMKLELWEGVLDETSLKFFRMRQRELGDRMSYTEEFAKMNARFSRDQNIGARRKWEEVTLYNQGKITSREWRDFEATFVLAWQEVEGATKEEARRLLLQKLPKFILNWVTEEEERRSISKPTIKMNAPWDMAENEMGDSVFVLTGKKPTKVSKARGGEFEIVLNDFSEIDKMLGYNGKCFRGTQIVVKVSRMENILDVEDIFLLVNQKLALKDRQELLQTASQPSFFRKQKIRVVENENKGGNLKRSKGDDKEKKQPEKHASSPKTPSTSGNAVQNGDQKTPAPQTNQQVVPPTSEGKGASQMANNWNGSRPFSPWNSGGRGPPGQWPNFGWQNPPSPWNAKGSSSKGQPNFGKGWNTFGQNWNTNQSKGNKGKGKGDDGKGKGRGGGGRG